MSIKRRNTRYIEINTGFFLILSVLMILTSFLLNFDYTTPNASIEEDLEFLKESISSQNISAIAWMIAGVSNLLLLPFYLILFHRFKRAFHIVIALLILIMAYCFFNIGLNELAISRASIAHLSNSDLNLDIPALLILPKIKQIIILRKIGITAFGAFATLIAVSKLDFINFPLLGSALCLITGPVIIFFIWTNPDHIILTSSLALGWIGMLMIGARLINKGLELKMKRTKES